jgi:hypothetical protein
VSQSINESGHVYGRLTVLERDHTRGPQYWQCACSCGSTKTVHIANLKSGRQQSCGCLNAERKRDNKYRLTHGQSYTPEYAAWHNMIQRCTRPNHAAWKDYGGRGISVCDEWMASFEVFIAHVGPRPDGMSIDRINNDGNYEPGNVRWATKRTQSNNQRPRDRPDVCPHGHIYSIANTYVNAKGYRKCRTCRREGMRAKVDRG